MESLAFSIIGGVIVYVAGQFLMKAVIEPSIEVKKLIGKIAYDLDFYANQMWGQLPEGDKARETFRQDACLLREKLQVVLAYKFFQRLLQLPTMRDAYEATGELIGHSNLPTNPQVGIDKPRDAEIKRLLRIRAR